MNFKNSYIADFQLEVKLLDAYGIRRVTRRLRNSEYCLNRIRVRDAFLFQTEVIIQ